MNSPTWNIYAMAILGTVLVRIGRESHQALQELSEQTGEPMGAVLARAIEESAWATSRRGLAQPWSTGCGSL